MISVVEIASRLGNGKEYDFSASREGWEPRRADDYVLPEFCIVESKAKGAEAKLRTKLSKVLAFIDSVKHKRFKEGCTIMPISVSNKANLAIWENKMGVSRAIAYMIEIGLISIESDKYQFGAYYEKDNKSKSYYYYRENEDKIKAYCEERGIEKYIVQNKVYDMADISMVHRDIDRSKVRFASRLKLIRPAGVSKDEFKKQLTLCLYENYPGLQFHTEKANEINKRYYKDYPEFRIQFEPGFSWSDDDSYVSGIGIRATNSMVNIKKELRSKILEAYGLDLEYDINASVPRMTASLNAGHWIDESVDIYKQIYSAMGEIGECSEEMREAIKKLHMRAYFDSSEKQVGHHTWLAMDQDGINKEDVCEAMKTFREAIVEAEGGKLYGSDIFYVESCVYLMTLYDLVTSGHKVWQVYDCFYASGEVDQELFEFMVSSGVRRNFEEFVSVWWKQGKE